MTRGGGLVVTLLLALAGVPFAFRHQLAELNHRRQSTILKRRSGIGLDRTNDAGRPLDPLINFGRVCLSAFVPTSVEDHRRRINFGTCLIVLFALVVLLLSLTA